MRIIVSAQSKPDFLLLSLSLIACSCQSLKRKMQAIYLLAGAILSLFTYLLHQTIARHRHLSDYPSIAPFASITNLAYIVHNVVLPDATTRTEVLHASHARHPVLRLGPARLSVASPAAIKDIYGTGSKCEKGDQFETPGGTPNLLSVVDRDWHAVKRKRLSAAFATSHLVDWEHKVQEKIRHLNAVM